MRKLTFIVLICGLVSWLNPVTVLADSANSKAHISFVETTDSSGGITKPKPGKPEPIKPKPEPVKPKPGKPNPITGGKVLPKTGERQFKYLSALGMILIVLFYKYRKKHIGAYKNEKN